MFWHSVFVFGVRAGGVAVRRYGRIHFEGMLVLAQRFRVCRNVLCRVIVGKKRIARFGTLLCLLNPWGASLLWPTGPQGRGCMGNKGALLRFDHDLQYTAAPRDPMSLPPRAVG